MDYGTAANKARAYQAVGSQSEIFSASPHRIIQMLMEGALDKISTAKGFMEHENYGAAGSHISWAISIIDGLRMSLDKDIKSPVTKNLDDLYDYMGHRLLEANQKHSTEHLVEVASLLKEIKSAWDQIPDSAKNAHANPGKYLK